MAVCSIDYIGKTYDEKDASYVASLHERVEETLITLGKGVVKKGFNNSKMFRPVNYRTETYAELQKISGRINSMFGGKVVHIKKDTGPNRRNYIIVNVNDIAKNNLFHYKDFFDLNKDTNVAEQEGEIIPIDDVSYEHRVQNLEGVDPLSLNAMLDQSVEMERRFNKAGIPVTVILDGDLNTAGALLGANSSKRKQMIEDGVITDSTYLISINPKNMTSDTLIHEFGHIFIDLIGGTSNGRVKAAYQKLIDTDVYNTVIELYPELDIDSDKFIKEVVNTALGKKATTLFTNKDNQNWWNRFVNWLNESVGRLFNVQKDVIEDLANDLLNIDKQSFSTQKVSDEEYFHKKSPQTKSTIEIISNNINSINDANKNIMVSIDKLVHDIERKLGQKLTTKSVADTSDQSEERRILKLKQLSEKFETIKKGEEAKFLLEFASEITETTDNFSSTLSKWIDKLNSGQDYNIDARVNKLGLISQYTNFFYIAESILKDINYMGLKGEQKEIVRKALSDATEKRDNIITDLVYLAIDVIVKTQAPNFDKIRTEYRDRFTIEYNSTKDDAVSDVLQGESKKDFIDRKMAEFHDEIIQETERYLESQLRESMDIGDIEKFLRPEKDINSATITVMSQLFDQADFQKNKNFIPYRTKAQPIFTKFKEQFGSNDMKKMYGDLIDESEDSAYLVGEYLPGFYDEYKSINKEIEDLVYNYEQETDKDKKKLIAKDIRLAKEKRDKWFKENTKEIEVSSTEKSNVPIDKWKNPKYAKIKANPNSAEAQMLSFLEEINDLADENTKGLKTLNRTIDGVETKWRRLPAINRDALERMYGGDYKENAQDLFERLFKRAPDEEELGETTDEEGNKFPNVKITRGNFAGDERHLVPIYFRHSFDKKTNSYDLLTAYMMNLYMSENFKAKSEIQPIAELLLNVNKQKKFIEGSGMKNLAKVFHVGGEITDMKAVQKKLSNENEKLQSMMENRLYGIKTIDMQFGKIAENIMAWTGTTMLALNFYSGISNLVQGKVMNFIEAVGGEFFNKKDLAYGESKFFKDMGAWVNDIGSHSPESRTMRLLDIFDPAGDFKGLSQRYIRSNKMKGLISRNSLSSPNRMGEMYVQGTLMYSVISKIKPLDSQGKFLDKNLRPTNDESKAVSLDEVITLNEDGTYSLPKEVNSTTFSYTADGNHDKIMLETKNLIKKITSDLHGQYDSELQSHAQRTVIGKAFFMLRKWIQPGVDRRFRGAIHSVGTDWMDFDQIDNEDFRVKRFYSQDTKSFREGTYTTMIRFTRQLHKEGELLKIFLAGKTKTWNKMTDHEKANVRKWVTEFATITLSLISAWILKGLGEELPEDEAQAVFLAAYTFRRLHQELVAYVNPLEALQLMRSPMASISMIENSLQLAGRVMYDGTNVIFLGNDAEVYQTGKRKGNLKIAKEFNDVFPILSQTNRNLEDVMEYTFKVY